MFDILLSIRYGTNQQTTETEYKMSDTNNPPYWSERNWIANQRKIVSEIRHNALKQHELEHTILCDQEVEILNNIFQKISDDEKATALLTHIVAFHHEKSLIF